MKITVKNCGDCPLKRTDLEGRVWCKTGEDMLLFGTGEGDPDYMLEQTVHPECPLLNGRATVHLFVNTKNAVTGNITARLGNRVELVDGTRGVVVGKFVKMGHINLPKDKTDALPEADRKGVWYSMLPDGGGQKYFPESSIKTLLKAAGAYNYNDLFEFYFGFGEDLDE